MRNMNSKILFIFLMIVVNQCLYAQLADGADALQSEIESFAEPASIVGVILGATVSYFSDENSIAKKIGIGAMFLSLILGAATFAGLFG